MLRAWRLAVFGAAIAAAMAPAHSQAQTKAHYVLGKPYQFDGVWYEPAVDYGYDQTGIAAIYPPDHAGLSTTSGEPYDGNAITGAHKTLPLPCLVRITNLENGKSIKVRLNDRGPFVDNRIVELTPAAAKALGVTNPTGVQVRVQIMAKESQAMADTLQPAGGAAAGVTPAPAPVVKVTALPLAGSGAMQPMKPVSAPGTTPPLPPQPTSPPADTTAATVPPANSTAAPVPGASATAPTIQLAIPLPQPTPAPAAPAAVTPSLPPATASAAAPAPTPPSTPAADTAQVHIVVPDVAPAAAPEPAPAPALITNPTAAPVSAAAAEPTPVVIPSPTPADPASETTVAPIPVVAPTPAPAAATAAAPTQTSRTVSASVTNSAEPTSTPAASAQAIPVQVSSAPAAPAAKIKPLPVDLPAQFFIQTGAFKKTADANALRDKLTALAPAKVVPTRLGADDFNAVLLGPIPTMNDAQHLLKQITGMGYSDAVLIIE